MKDVIERDLLEVFVAIAPPSMAEFSIKDEESTVKDWSPI